MHGDSDRLRSVKTWCKSELAAWTFILAKPVKDDVVGTVDVNQATSFEFALSKQVCEKPSERNLFYEL